MSCSPAGFEWAHDMNEPRRTIFYFSSHMGRGWKWSFILALGRLEAQTQRRTEEKTDTSSGRSEHKGNILHLCQRHSLVPTPKDQARDRSRWVGPEWVLVLWSPQVNNQAFFCLGLKWVKMKPWGFYFIPWQ